MVSYSSIPNFNQHHDPSGFTDCKMDDQTEETHARELIRLKNDGRFPRNFRIRKSAHLESTAVHYSFSQLGTREPFRLKCVFFVAIVLCFLCQSVASSSTPSLKRFTRHIEQSLQQSSARRRWKNTGFYYGLRDVDIPSSTKDSISSTLHDCSGRMQTLDHFFRAKVQSLKNKYPLHTDEFEMKHGRLTQVFNPIFVSQSCKSLLQSTFTPSLRATIATCIAQSLTHSYLPQESQFTMLNRATSLVGGSLIASPRPRSENKVRRKNNTGFYYGIREDVVLSRPRDRRKEQHKRQKTRELASGAKKRPPYQVKSREPDKQKEQPRTPFKPPKKHSSETEVLMGQTLVELREMRTEIMALREELCAVKEKLQSRGDEIADKVVDEKTPWWQGQSSDELQPEPNEGSSIDHRAQSPKHRRLEQISKEVEVWATALLNTPDREAGGWKQISCNKLIKNKFNHDGRTSVYLKWMTDTRPESDRETHNTHSTQEYPCLKCYSTIDAPLDSVCAFLANENTIPLYNDLVQSHADVEEITPSSKITWCKAPQILFVKPRDFVTYCAHHWRRDGCQVIINQAVEHDSKPGRTDTRGFAIRGANFIFGDPNDPNKTIISMVSQATPGGGLPSWAMNTAVKGVVQVEPFKFFHKINEGVQSYQEESGQTETVGLSSRSKKPAGMGHLGFTCFWPNGGGEQEQGSCPAVLDLVPEDDYAEERDIALNS